MDAITMQSTSLLAAKLQIDYPEFRFYSDQEFRWDPRKNTVFYNATLDDQASLLHELAHAILQHASYKKDLELLQLERDAWHYATSVLSKRYSLTIREDEVEDALDTYRDWLHARSTCPKCTQTGLESRKNTYKCIACGTHWRVNEARICGLKRHVIN